MQCKYELTLCSRSKVKQQQYAMNWLSIMSIISWSIQAGFGIEIGAIKTIDALLKQVLFSISRAHRSYSKIYILELKYFLSIMTYEKPINLPSNDSVGL